MGAPILFFVGAFIYTTVDTRNSELGDDDSAHALAFGMCKSSSSKRFTCMKELTIGIGYMTVPCLAIISCAMLASGNPTALQGMIWDGSAGPARVSSFRSFSNGFKSKMERYALSRWFLNKIRGYELLKSTYEGNFEPSSLWNRGPNKRRWVQEAIKDYAANFPELSDEGSISPEEVSRALKEKVGEVANALVMSLALLIIPSALAFITSYNTPRKGISCRTLTYSVYGICQIFECLLWIWEIWLKIKYGERWSEARTRSKAINYCGQLFFGFWAVFAAVIGTLMQLLGVYRTCACMVSLLSSFT